MLWTLYAFIEIYSYFCSVPVRMLAFHYFQQNISLILKISGIKLNLSWKQVIILDHPKVILQDIAF